jgi:hypothetical protein
MDYEKNLSGDFLMKKPMKNKLSDVNGYLFVKIERLREYWKQRRFDFEEAEHASGG